MTRKFRVKKNPSRDALVTIYHDILAKQSVTISREKSTQKRNPVGKNVDS